MLLDEFYLPPTIYPDNACEKTFQRPSVTCLETDPWYLRYRCLDYVCTMHKHIYTYLCIIKTTKPSRLITEIMNWVLCFLNNWYILDRNTIMSITVIQRWFWLADEKVWKKHSLTFITCDFSVYFFIESLLDVFFTKA